MCKNTELHWFKEKYYSKFTSEVQIIELVEHPSVIVITKYGTHKVNKVALMAGNIPTIQTSLNKFKHFYLQAEEVHGDKYFYPEFDYENQRQKIKIICAMHGEFEQEIRFHLSGNGCKRCQYDKQRIDKSFTIDIFIEKSRQIHGDFYNYSKCDYVNIKEKVCIICPLHNEFCQSPSEHLKGHGCYECGLMRKSNLMSNSPVGWTLTNWTNAGKVSKNFDSFKVYIIECWNDNEIFYKIGRTFTKTEKRFKSNGKRFPYKFKVLKEIIGDADNIFKLENTMKNIHKEYQYEPKIYFQGHKECYSKILII
jgi:hypothetical protein